MSKQRYVMPGTGPAQKSDGVPQTIISGNRYQYEFRRLAMGGGWDVTGAAFQKIVDRMSDTGWRYLHIVEVARGEGIIVFENQS